MSSPFPSPRRSKKLETSTKTPRKTDFPSSLSSLLSLLVRPLQSTVRHTSSFGSFPASSSREENENFRTHLLVLNRLVPFLTEPCDEQRPCARCTKRGPKFAEECRDSDRKPKKGMPRSRAARAARTSAPSAAGGGGEVAKPVLTMTAAAGFVERGGGSGGGLALESNASSSTAMSRRAGLRGGGGLGESSCFFSSSSSEQRDGKEVSKSKN